MNKTEKELVEAQLKKEQKLINDLKKQYEESLKKPLDVGEVIIDDEGRPSVKYIGKKTTVILNPESKKIVTAWPTSTRIRKKYGKDE